MNAEEILNELKVKKDQLDGLGEPPSLPEKPPRFENLEAAQAWMWHYNEVDIERGRLESVKKGLLLEIESLRAQLRSIIPVRNSYIRIGDYGVALYTDAWGGHHTVCKIVEWRDDLDAEPDRLHYD